MADTAKTIIESFSYVDGNWKSDNYIKGEEAKRYKIFTQPSVNSTQLIDIDQYYNFYNVVSPRVEVEFFINGNWININQQLTNSVPVFYANLKDDNGNKIKKEVVFKNGEYNYNNKPCKEGDEIGGAKIESFEPKYNKQNNFFVSATIEDTGYRSLQLELYDRTFTTVQALLYKAIESASKPIEKNAGTKKSDSGTTFNLEFLQTPSLTNNNIRIRYGYNEDVNTKAKEGYWSAAKLNSNFYSGDDKYRWVSRNLNNEDLSVGEDSDSNVHGGDEDAMGKQHDISSDVVLFNFNNQSTVLGGFEEFYITNVQTNLTNTGMKYTINAIGNDALKLNGYKFVQKYANIVDKPKNILASLMRCFNYTSKDKPTTTKDTLIKLVFLENDLAEEKKIIKNKEGNYEELTKDEQDKKLEEKKEQVSGLSKKNSVLGTMLGLLTNKKDEDKNEYIAGTTVSQKQLYSGWDFNKNVWINNEKLNKAPKNLSDSLKIACLAQKEELGFEQEIILNYWAKNYGANRININSASEANINSIKLPNVARAVAATIAAENIYDVSSLDIIDKINEKFKGKAAQSDKISALMDIFLELKNYAANLLKDYSVHLKYKLGDYTLPFGLYNYWSFIKMPKSFFTALTTDEAMKMIAIIYKDVKEKDGINLEESTNNRYIFSPAAESFDEKLDVDKGISGFFSTSGTVKVPTSAKGPLGYNQADKFIDLLKELTTVSEADVKGKLETLEKTSTALGAADDFTAKGTLNRVISICYALGISGYKGNDEPESIKSGNDIIYCAFSGSSTAHIDTIKGQSFSDGSTIETDWLDDSDTSLKEIMDNRISDEKCKSFLDNLDYACKRFKRAYKEEMDGRTKGSEDENYGLISKPEDQIKKIVGLIKNQTPTVSEIKVKTNNGEEAISKLSDGSSFKELFNLIKNTNSNDNNVITMAEQDFQGKAKAITDSLKKCSEDYNKANQDISSLTSDAINDEISLSLGGPEALQTPGGEQKTFYKSISSLLTEFCNACPPLHDYAAEIDRKVAWEKAQDGNGQSTESIKTYKDENDNDKQLDLSGAAPTYKLGWSIVGYYNDGVGKIPVVGISYNKPKKPAKIRVYKWGSGNPDRHAIKNVNITTESEFAMLSSAANSQLKFTGGRKVAIRKTNEEAMVNGESPDAELAAIYDDYQPQEKPAYFKTVANSDKDYYNITDAMFQAINKGTITILGDPSLRFGGDISPMSYPIYLDISLQGEGVTWGDGGNLGQKSTLSGVYVVSKITHSLNLQGYTTTLEVLRYPGINETLAIPAPVNKEAGDFGGEMV